MVGNMDWRFWAVVVCGAYLATTLVVMFVASGRTKYDDN